MLSANAVANEVAIAMLDKFDLTGWQFSGEETPGGGARVIVTPPKLPPATGYWVVVSTSSDVPLDQQVQTAVDNLSKLLTEGAQVQAGTTPDDQLSNFFAGLNMPPDQAKQAQQQEMDKRHPPQQQQGQAASPS